MYGHFVKTYVTQARIVSESLSDREWAALTRLSLWIRFRDNRIVGRHGQPMTQEEIAQTIGKSLRQTKDILAELERRGLLHSYRIGRRKGYAIDERFCYRGGSPKEREYAGVKTATKAMVDSVTANS